MNLTLEEVFEAYYECRKTKRYSNGALQFEVNLEENLIQLYSELKAKTWIPRKSNAYVLKLDIKGFFMNIDKNLLWQKLLGFFLKRKNYF